MCNTLFGSIRLFGTLEYWCVCNRVLNSCCSEIPKCCTLLNANLMFALINGDTWRYMFVSHFSKIPFADWLVSGVLYVCKIILTMTSAKVFSRGLSTAREVYSTKGIIPLVTSRPI